MNLSDLNIDGAEGLPAIQQEQPRDQTNGRFLSPAQQQPETPEPSAPARQHSFIALQSAHALGISKAVATSMPPEVLEELITSLQASRQTAPRPEARAEPAPEDAIDWGDDDEGNPLTEEQAKKLYKRPVFNAIKNGTRVEKLEKQLEQERQDRRAERYHTTLAQLYKTRPDLFGAKAPQDPFSTEGRRRRLVEAEIGALVQAKRQTTLEDDWAAIVADLYGDAQAEPAPKPAAKNGTQNGHQQAPKPQADPAAAYANAELARPTARRSADTRSYRDRRIDEVAAQMRERGQSIPSPTTDDDADLPAHDYDQPRR